MTHPSSSPHAVLLRPATPADIGHILAFWITIGSDTPVGTGLGLVPAHRGDGRADDVLLGRRNANGFQALQQAAVQLVAVHIVGLLVSGCAPWRLVDGLVDDVGKLARGADGEIQ